MKRFILLIAVVIGFLGTINGQTYYNMWRGNGDSGKPEWISNLSTRTYDQLSGIQFTTANSCRGFVNVNGRWGFLKPNSSLAPISLSNIIAGMPSATMGIEGWLATEGITVRKLSDTTTNTLDLQTSGTKSTIIARGDTEGFDIISQNRKIYLVGKVGVGFSGADIASQLHVKDGYITNEDSNIKTCFGITTQTDRSWVGTVTENGMYIGANLKKTLYMAPNGKMYVGFNDGQIPTVRTELMNKYSIFVKQGILSEDYAIAPASSWADFVFNRGYNLPLIQEVESFIQANNHLPDVPSAKQVAEEGYSQHEMNKILLQKIEELTLYTIQQQKEIDALKTQLQESNN